MILRRSLPHPFVFLLAGALGWNSLAAAPAATSTETIAKPSVKVIRFEDLKPDDARLTTCWDGVGIDGEQRVYIALSDQSDKHPFDTIIFRYDTRTGGRERLATLREISRNDGNLLPGETIAKTHVGFHEHDGKFYFSSHDYHQYEGAIDLAKRRGGHIYSYDLTTGTFSDLSKGDAGGISVAQQGIIGLSVMPKQNKLAGITFPFGDIVIHDLKSGTTRFYQGVDRHRKRGKPSRQIFSTDSGKVYFSYYDSRPAPMYVFDLATEKITETPYRYNFGMIYGALRTKDGQRIYLVDTFGTLYVFHTADERLEQLGSLLPPDQIEAGITVRTCYAMALSSDESRLYTFPSRLSVAPALRVYEYEVASGKRRQVADFTAEINGSSGTVGGEDRNGRITGAGVIDDQGRMYFGYHESGDDGRNGALLQVSLPTPR